MTPDEQLDANTRRSFQGLAWALVVLLLAVGAWCASAIAAEYTRDGGTADWQCCADKACTTVISQHADPVRAEKACARLTDADGVTRYTRSHAFRITPSSAPPPACPAKPADEMRAGVCPTGTTGSWTQTRTYASAAAPTCWTAGAWLPSAPPTGACTASPPPSALTLEQPSVTPAATAGLWHVKLIWNALPGVSSYEVHRCTGEACSVFGYIADATATTYTNTGLPSGVTYGYRVRGGSLTSNTRHVTLSATPTPPPATGTAILRWTPPTQNTDGSALTDLAGYRIVYGATATALVSTVEVANPAISTYVVDKLAPGTWYFAVRAYTTRGYESTNSNVASQVVP